MFQADGGGTRTKFFGEEELGVEVGGEGWREEKLVPERPTWVSIKGEEGGVRREREREETIRFEGPFVTVSHTLKMKIIWYVIFFLHACSEFIGSSVLLF